MSDADGRDTPPGKRPASPTPGPSPVGRRPPSPELSPMPAAVPATPSPPRPVSPRRASTRMAKVLASDPSTELTPNLGKKSTSHPNVAFGAGGGFTARTKVTRQLSADEVAAKHQDKMDSWRAHGERGQPPKPPKATETVFQGDLEYHPPGGIHSNYDPSLSDVVGGSYLRVKQSAPAPAEQRYSRHGPFANTADFTGAPLHPRPPAARGPAETAPPPEAPSPPPSPRTARALAQRLYDAPEPTMAALASGRPYRDIAGTRTPPVSPPGTPPAAPPGMFRPIAPAPQTPGPAVPLLRPQPVRPSAPAPDAPSRSGSPTPGPSTPGPSGRKT